MLEKKILQTSIDLFKPNEIYAPDLDAILINKLKERYNSRCYKSMLILDITRIIKRGLSTSAARSDGGHYVNVMFEALGHVFYKGEIIQGCRITHITNEECILNHPHASIRLSMDSRANNLSNIFRVDMKIPCIIEETNYTLYAKEATVIAMPFIPIPDESIIYIISGQSGLPTRLSQEDLLEIDELSTKISDEEKKHETLKKENIKAYELFKIIMYPYKTIHNFGITEAAKKLKMSSALIFDDVLKGNIAVLYASPEEPQSLKKVYYIDEKNIQAVSEQLENYQSPTVSHKSALLSIYHRYLLYLVNLRSFIEYFKDPKLVEQYKKYWELCKEVKQ